MRCYVEIVCTCYEVAGELPVKSNPRALRQLKRARGVRQQSVGSLAHGALQVRGQLPPCRVLLPRLGLLVQDLGKWEAD